MLSVNSTVILQDEKIEAHSRKSIIRTHVLLTECKIVLWRQTCKQTWQASIYHVKLRDNQGRACEHAVQDPVYTPACAGERTLAYYTRIALVCKCLHTPSGLKASKGASVKIDWTLIAAHTRMSCLSSAIHKSLSNTLSGWTSRTLAYDADAEACAFS